MTKKENKPKFIDLERSIYHEKQVPKNFEVIQEKVLKNISNQIKKPNKITLKAMRNTDKRKNLVKCKDAQDMFKKLGI